MPRERYALPSGTPSGNRLIVVGVQYSQPFDWEFLPHRESHDFISYSFIIWSPTAPLLSPCLPDLGLLRVLPDNNLSLE